MLARHFSNSLCSLSCIVRKQRLRPSFPNLDLAHRKPARSLPQGRPHGVVHAGRGGNCTFCSERVGVSDVHKKGDMLAPNPAELSLFLSCAHKFRLLTYYFDL